MVGRFPWWELLLASSADEESGAQGGEVACSRPLQPQEVAEPADLEPRLTHKEAVYQKGPCGRGEHCKSTPFIGNMTQCLS